GAADLGFADAQRIDALVDDGDRPLLDVGTALAGREVVQLVVDVRAAREVQTTVEVELPAAKVGWQPRDVACQLVVVRDPVDVARAVYDKREGEDRHDQKANRPAEN